MNKLTCRNCKKSRWTRRYADKCKVVAPKDITAHVCKPCRKKLLMDTGDLKSTKQTFKRVKKSAPVQTSSDKNKKKGKKNAKGHDKH